LTKEDGGCGGGDEWDGMLSNIKKTMNKTSDDIKKSMKKQSKEVKDALTKAINKNKFE